MNDPADPVPFASLQDLEACLCRMQTLTSDEDNLTELAHGLQCADILERWAPADLELQLAGLLHDIGSALGYPEDHGPVGASVLRDIFGERVSELVRLHVDAKRYLVAVDADYCARLSLVSIKTLALQGGPMSMLEAREFGESLYRDDAIRLRQADDLAKTPGCDTQSLETWLRVVHRVHGAN